MKQIGEGGFAKVYSATWIDGIAKYIKDDGNWIKKEPKSMIVALKRLNGLQNMSTDFLNELKTHWKLSCLHTFTFSNLSKPINSSFIATTFLNEEDNEDCQDSQLVNLEVPNDDNDD
ncbi:kinase-like domain-containing protein [Rhizophagus irregularis DAOM 181602=DAOM 197198]|nr:kinase-like domain-containing protein [Rhizophagus irregularis DAOM 181602=DAOM 197198]